MQRILLPLIAALALPTAVNAEAFNININLITNPMKRPKKYKTFEDIFLVIIFTLRVFLNIHNQIHYFNGL